MYYMLHKYTLGKVASVFYIYPTKEHYLKGIGREIKLAHTSVIQQLNELKKLNLIKENIQIKGKRRFPVYKANINNRIFTKYKLLYNFMSILDSGLIEFIHDNMMPKSIVLFGSYRRGEDTEESDIDLFIAAREKNVDIIRFEKILKRKIQLHYKENFIEFPDELKNNIANGIVLDGYLEVY